MRIPVLCLMTAICAWGTVNVRTDPRASLQERFGAERLTAAFAGLTVDGEVVAATHSSALLSELGGHAQFQAGRAESFRILRKGNRWFVIGSDATGVLYGCLDLADRVRNDGRLPQSIDVADGPAFKIRGTNLFWMKFGDKGYDWPVTRENFPWFFDRTLMLRYLDQLAANRYNTIFFWTGHPFPYFLELPRFPEARMLEPEELKRNMEHLRWFTTEATRRGIWTVFHFYNIHVSPNFAKAHEREGVRTANPASTPLLASYMRHAVSEFVESYPNVGLMLTAGEALHVKQEEYIRDVIVGGIRDSGKRPPLIVRQWAIDAGRYREIVKSSYDNLYTMMKHNTEMLISPHPDERNRDWVAFGQNHIVNLHENSDIKPFRWASPVFIQQMVSNWRQWGVSGIHLYPLVSWQWPLSLDRADPPLLAVNRDRDWMAAFGRYAWNPNRAPAEEERFWRAELNRRFGEGAGDAVYEYYVKTGPVMPGLQNLVNIANMNFHPTAVSQEARLNGILHSDRWAGIGDPLSRPLDDFTLDWMEKRFGKLSVTARRSPPRSVKGFVRCAAGARCSEAVEPQPLTEVFVEMADQALEALERGAGLARQERQEYSRFVNDARCIVHLARFYRAKVAAAIEKGIYDHGGDDRKYERMLEHLATSVEEYSRLSHAATPAYRQVTDLGEWYRWTTVDADFQEELAFYREQRDVSRSGAEIVYLGQDGPAGNSGDTFYWLLERYRSARNWKSQSYCLGDRLLAKARLVVVSDLSSPVYRKHRPELIEWVRRGGKVLVWDPLGRAFEDPLVEGITFRSDATRRGGSRFAFTAANETLLSGLSDTRVTLEAANSLRASMVEATGDWHELAYTVLPNTGGGQFHRNWETFGPRWTSLMNQARIPLMLARNYGAGSLVVAQLGSWNASAKPQMSIDRSEEAPPFLHRLARNLIAWADAPQ
ncbi:MAG: hypothetical protein ACKV22_37760 [Bryobacteraceae bacterium]